MQILLKIKTKPSRVSKENFVAMQILRKENHFGRGLLCKSLGPRESANLFNSPMVATGISSRSSRQLATVASEVSCLWVGPLSIFGVSKGVCLCVWKCLCVAVFFLTPLVSALGFGAGAGRYETKVLGLRPVLLWEILLEEAPDLLSKAPTAVHAVRMPTTCKHQHAQRQGSIQT